MATGYLSTATRTLIKASMKKVQDTFAQSTLVLQIPGSVTEDYPYQAATSSTTTTVTLSCVKYVTGSDSKQVPFGQSIDCDMTVQLWVDDMEAEGLNCTILGIDTLTRAIAVIDGESFEVAKGELLDGNIVPGEYMRCNLYLNRINSRRK